MTQPEVFSGCIQPLHICPCDGCDLERRRRVRMVAERWFEAATWRLLRRRAQARIDAEIEHARLSSHNDAVQRAAQDSLFPAAESGVRPTVRNSSTQSTHRALRAVRLK